MATITNSLVAVFATDGRACEAARRVRNLGVDDRDIRIGDPPRSHRPRRSRHAPNGTTLAVPDSADARHVMLTAGSLRVDVGSPAGTPVETLASHERAGTRPGRAM